MPQGTWITSCYVTVFWKVRSTNQFVHWWFLWKKSTNPFCSWAQFQQLHIWHHDSTTLNVAEWSWHLFWWPQGYDHCMEMNVEAGEDDEPNTSSNHHSSYSDDCVCKSSDASGCWCNTDSTSLAASVLLWVVMPLLFSLVFSRDRWLTFTDLLMLFHGKRFPQAVPLYFIYANCEETWTKIL